MTFQTSSKLAALSFKDQVLFWVKSNDEPCSNQDDEKSDHDSSMKWAAGKSANQKER